MGDKSKIVWEVTYSIKASKQRKKMPKIVQDAVDTLVLEMEREGPWRKTGLILVL